MKFWITIYGDYGVQGGVRYYDSTEEARADAKRIYNAGYGVYLALIAVNGDVPIKLFK